MIQPTFYLGPKPVLRSVFAVDEWGMAEVLSGTTEDDPVLGTPGLKGKSNVSMMAAPKKSPEGDASRMGPTWGYGAKLV